MDRQPLPLPGKPTRWRKRLLIATIVALAWIAIVIPAGRGTCDDFEPASHRAACHLALAPVIALGVVDYQRTRLLSLPLPPLHVEVELDDKTVAQATVTRGSRVVHQGDRLRLDCTRGQPAPGGQTLCELRYFRSRPFDPTNKGPDAGKTEQDPTPVTVSSDGIPDPSVLRLNRAVPGFNGREPARGSGP